MPRAKLILEDGKEFMGKALGAQGKETILSSFGEIVFNTSMTGYQEILTDPSYAGQIITFTYPEIGNYGCNTEDYESKNSFIKGMVLKNPSPIVSNWRAEESLEDFLNKHKIPAIYDLDTRALTRHIRDKGAMRAAIINESHDNFNDSKKLLEEIKASEKMDGLDLASRVSCKEAYTIKAEDKKFKIIAFDFGIKTNILNKLAEHGCEIEVVPANTPASYILKANPDGIFLSNGPGDPSAVDYAIETIKELIEKFNKPIFGICLGHQLLSLAAGAKTYKLKFGHRGANQPIKNLQTSKIEISSHNHGFAVSEEGLPENLEITHLNINDDTIAGLKFKDRNIFSVQYHPEASPGPHDSDYLFREFIELIKSKAAKASS